ncbi:MAG: MATE family efflux transporter [Leptolyngbya sp. SIO4C1]|nr:MATE family efflux transporter [Leptolyngbya sp. SIO4C1]
MRLAIANIISNLLVPLAGLIDTAFLGHLADIHHLGGVALANIIFNVVFWSFGFLRMATTGLTAQAVGRADPDEIWRVGGRSLLLGLGLGLLILLLQWPLRELGFALLQAAPDVLAAGRDFYSARIWGAPAVLMNYALLGWFLGQSQGRAVIVLSLVSNGGNILLDYWFIRQLGWASYGAGLATALSQYAMLLVGLSWMLKDWRPTPWPELWETSALRSLFGLNGHILVRTFALVISFALFTNISSGLGTDILAINTLLLQVVLLASYFIDGFAFATESYAGQLQGQVARLRSLLKLAGGLSLFFGLAFAIAFGLWPRSLFGLLTNHAEILTPIAQYTAWLLPVLGFGGIAFMLDGYFLGLTAGRVLRNSTLLASAIGFLPGAIAAYWLSSPHLLWLAMACFMLLRAATLGWVVPATLAQRVAADFD